jgi:hypothetical protein
MRAKAAFVTVLALAGCGARAAAPPPETHVEVADRLGPVEWLVGTWQREGGLETWSVARGALVGVGFTAADDKTRAWEVMFIKVADGRATITAMPSGSIGVDFPEAEKTETSITFSNPEHDFPKHIRYALEAPNALVATVSGAGEAQEVYRFTAATAPVRARELEERVGNLAGGDAENTARAFDERGVFWSATSGRVVGREAIRGALAASRRGAAYRFARGVTGSGLSPSGDLGYTVGPTHLSVWRKQPDGGWLMAFDAMF